MRVDRAWGEDVAERATTSAGRWCRAPERWLATSRLASVQVENRLKPMEEPGGDEEKLWRERGERRRVAEGRSGTNGAGEDTGGFASRANRGKKNVARAAVEPRWGKEGEEMLAAGVQTRDWIRRRERKREGAGSAPSWDGGLWRRKEWTIQ